MDSQKVDMYLMVNARYFPKDKLPLLRNILGDVVGNQEFSIQTISFISPNFILVISIIFGHFGVDRFVLGHFVLGLLKLCTIGGLGCWTLIDWFLIRNATREANYTTLMNAIGNTMQYNYK